MENKLSSRDFMSSEYVFSEPQNKYKTNKVMNVICLWIPGPQSTIYDTPDVFFDHNSL